MSPTLPARIGRFDVVDLIGTGAFATVFRARDERLDADVALKVLAENHSFDPDLRERFITEGHLLRRVDSPHVVTVFDLGETDAGQPYLVLDLALGGDLRARRRAWGDRPVPQEDLELVATQVAAALGALHGERVVHRDVTPGNLLIRTARGAAGPPPDRLLGPDERLLLADLGLSKDLALASGLTTGAGTAGFAPPEQRDAAWVDRRADIWSASALLVWLLTGRAVDDRGWADAVRRQYPAALAEVLARGLTPVVTARQPDAATWRDEVLAALAPPPPSPPPRTGDDPARHGARDRPPFAWWAVVVVAVLLALVGGVLGGRTLGGDEGAAVRTEELDDGRVRSRAVDGPLDVAAVGPAEVAVGEAATFTAEVDGATSFVWVAPDGQVYVDTATVTLRPDSAGEAEVRLVGVDDAGRSATATAVVRVTEP